MINYNKVNSFNLTLLNYNFIVILFKPIELYGNWVAHQH